MDVLTVKKIKEMKGRQPIVMLTAYDYISARICQACGVDIILVGDSLAMTLLGYDSTLPVTMDEMGIFVSAVRRGAKDAFIVADMPFMSYQASIEQALENAGRFIKSCGASAVKIEGASDHTLSVVDRLVDAGIQVMGHIGLTPQSSIFKDGYKVKGRDFSEARELMAQAKALEDAGCFAIVLECVPEPLGADISDAVGIPVIGIGAGRFCDGQVLVFSDVVGTYDRVIPRFVRRYCDGLSLFRQAVEEYVTQVRKGEFPGEENVYK